MIKYKKLPEDILQKLPLLEPLFEKDERVLFAYIFGGVSLGTLKPLSDLDIAIYLAPLTNSGEARIELAGQIADILGTDELDLVILNTAPLSLAGRIVAKKQIISDKSPFIRHAFESRIMREFFDFSRKEKDILSRRFA